MDKKDVVCVYIYIHIYIHTYKQQSKEFENGLMLESPTKKGKIEV